MENLESISRNFFENTNISKGALKLTMKQSTLDPVLEEDFDLIQLNASLNKQ